MATSDWNTHDECEDCQECDCNESGDRCSECEGCSCHDDSPGNKVRHHKPVHWGINPKEAYMNKTVAKLFETTADAMLVNKFYGTIIADNDVSYITLKDNEGEILAAAKVLQEKEDERKKK